MKEGKGMTKKCEQHISLGFLAISFLLFAVSVLCYANETVQFYFVKIGYRFVAADSCQGSEILIMEWL